jgi:hypothetical protein
MFRWLFWLVTMNMASKLAKIVEAFDQKVGPDY